MPRRFIRHPANIPIHLDCARASGHADHHLGTTVDVSAGGLSCHSDQLLSPGDRVEVKIVVEGAPFKTIGHVVWCHRDDQGYLIGIGFSDMATAYAVRMVEQVCHIEEYRQRIKAEEGRELNADEAAHEWITLHAEDFPQQEH
jgi:hypothetical protein